MRAFEFTDSEGRRQSVADVNGRYVLFHVWASWCQPCLDSMPAVKSIVEQRSQDPLTVVGLNIDEDPDAAKALAERGGWSWAQNYLGDDSDMMRQLGVSSVPAYYLIGRDGKLVGSANEWEQVEKMLSAEVK
jgi:thioredoxin-like negative regulator of GroEL